MMVLAWAMLVAVRTFSSVASPRTTGTPSSSSGRQWSGSCSTTAKGMPRWRRMFSLSAVVVKVSKPIQDERFDVPAIGVDTVKTMCEAGVRVLAIEAGKAIVFDRREMIRLADAHDVAIVALVNP